MGIALQAAKKVVLKKVKKEFLIEKKSFS